ncbi:MAG: hypothetical protein AB8V04_04440 [Candidatus Midichloria sp.]
MELDKSASQQISSNAIVMLEIRVAVPYPIGTVCNGDLATKISNSTYKTKFIVRNCDKFDFSLSAADNIENKIYMVW